MITVTFGLSHQQRSWLKLACLISNDHGHIWPVLSAKVLVTAGLSYQQRSWLQLACLISKGLGYSWPVLSAKASVTVAFHNSKGHSHRWPLLSAIVTVTVGHSYIAAMVTNTIGLFYKQRLRLQLASLTHDRCWPIFEAKGTFAVGLSWQQKSRIVDVGGEGGANSDDSK